MSRSDLRDLLLLCCADEAPDVRQSALALLGDLVKVLSFGVDFLTGFYVQDICILKDLCMFILCLQRVSFDHEQACAVHLQPRLAEFLNLAAKQLVSMEE